jgi:hypothetical protein
MKIRLSRVKVEFWINKTRDDSNLSLTLIFDGYIHLPLHPMTIESGFSPIRKFVKAIDVLSHVKVRQ